MSEHGGFFEKILDGGRSDAKNKRLGGTTMAALASELPEQWAHPVLVSPQGSQGIRYLK